LARMPQEQLDQLLRGYGYAPRFVAVEDPRETRQAHADFARALEACLAEIEALQRAAREDAALRPGAGEAGHAPRWPMIVLRSPKGWTCPATVDGRQVEGTWRAHQVPLADVRSDPDHLAQLEQWLLSYRPGELFDDAGRLRPRIAALAPAGDLRMSATPHASGGRLLRDLRLPAYAEHAVAVATPGREPVSPMLNLGNWLREVVRLNPENFRVFGPDETASNRLM
ncbi:phosphoketolase, partial [Arthrobacter deserti]|nr:phosphoketolase [Arthrobacter deserti]